MPIFVQPASASTFANYGELIVAPTAAGERAFYSHWLGSEHPGTTPRIHVNCVLPVTLPHSVTSLERHPFAAQMFLPLEVDRYLVVVAPSQSDGDPDLLNVQAFVVPGNVGVVYRKGTWHACATVLGRTAHFAVSMWRNDKDDDQFLQLAVPLILEA